MKWLESADAWQISYGSPGEEWSVCLCVTGVPAIETFKRRVDWKLCCQCCNYLSGVGRTVGKSLKTDCGSNSLLCPCTDLPPHTLLYTAIPLHSLHASLVCPLKKYARSSLLLQSTGTCSSSQRKLLRRRLNFYCRNRHDSDLLLQLFVFLVFVILQFAAIYIHTYVFLGVLVGLTLFVGVIIFNFNKNSVRVPIWVIRFFLFGIGIFGLDVACLAFLFYMYSSLRSASHVVRNILRSTRAHLSPRWLVRKGGEREKHSASLTSL